jgi:hypothetical protein
MPVVIEKEDKPVEWTPELEALAKAPLYPSTDAAPEAEPAKQRDHSGRFAPPPVEQPPDDPVQEQTPGESASAESAAESESGDGQAEPAGLEPDEIGLAKTYGFTDQEIGEFKTSADLARAIAPFERRLMAKREEPPAETNAPAQPQAKPPAANGKPPAELPADDDLNLDPELVDEQVASKWNKLTQIVQAERAQNAKLAEQMNFILHRERQLAQWEQVRHFDSLVDSLGDDKFGPEDFQKRTTEQHNARAKLWEETGLMLYRLAQSPPAAGMQVGLSKAIVSRAKLYAFPDEIRKQETAKVQQAVVKQSQKRLGKPSTSRVLAGPQKDPDKDPESMSALQRIWNEMAAENGTVPTR